MKKFTISERITETDENVKRYLNDISGDIYNPLTADEEVEYAKLVQLGDMVALEKLTRANLRFVVSVAKSYQGNGIPLNDLINEGNAGLIKAAHRFDTTKGFKFITYAVWWIRQSITQSLSDNAASIRMPLNHINMDKKIRNSKNELYKTLGYNPSVLEIAEDLGLSEVEVGKCISNNTRKTESLDKPIDDDNSSTIEDTLPNDGMNADKKIEQEDLKSDVCDMLDTLSGRDRDIMSKLYGLEGQEEKSMDTIAEEYKMTKERIRQIKMSSIGKLKKLNYTN